MTFLVWAIYADSGNAYEVAYDSTIGVITTKTGTAPDDTTITEDELRNTDGSLIYDNCIDGDRHKIYLSTTYPFATADVIYSDPTCIVVPPTPPPPPVIPPPVVTANYIAYQVRFKNFEEQIVTANIFDQTTYEEGRTIEYRPLKPSGDPVIIECIDNDEDKFTSIRAKQCLITFNSSNTLNLNTFIEGEDARWYVEVDIEGQIIFKGFLVTQDMTEDFLSPPNVVELMATDGIGLLKDIPLTNFDGVSPIIVRPKEKYRWIDYLGWALSKTGLSLTINIEHNLREELYAFEPFFDKVYLDPKTFEDEIGTCINCYEVIERLLANECFLTQRHGEWWIVRVDEIDSRTRYVYVVEPTLTYIVLTTPTLEKTIKKDENIKWINRTAYVGADAKHSKIQEKFSFDYPKEIVDNIDFTRGDQILIVSTPPDVKHYHLLDWTFFRYPGTTASAGYIRRIFNEFNIEKERFVVIDKSATSGSGLGVHALQSSRVPMLEKDKFTFSVDRRLELNLTGTEFMRTSIAQIRLYASDGTYWVLAGLVNVGGNKIPSHWVTTDSTFTTNADYVWYEGNRMNDDREWHGVNEEVAPLPKSGEIEILLLQSADNPTTSETHFANLNITYSPYINGTYQKYSGQQWKVSQEGDYKAAREDQVYVTDGTRPLFKGAMQKYNAQFGVWQLTDSWFDNSLTPYPPSEYNAYGWFQAQSVWNQYRRVMRIFDGELLGLTENDLPDLIHSYTLADPSSHTNLREFICLHYSMSLKTCRWTAFFAEVFKSDQEKIYTDTTEFKYIENRGN